MKTIEAIYNAGRWIALCPIHGKAGAVLVENVSSDMPNQSEYIAKEEYICPVCYPGVVAQFPTLQWKRIVNIPDRSARATARLLAHANDDIYTVIFPEEREQIEQVLASRPHLMRNWDGHHETLEFLEKENHVIENFNKRKQVTTPEELDVKVVKKRKRRKAKS